MFIKAVRLRNFRSHIDTSIGFGERNLFFGPNRAGKSSILDAISFALTGTCRGTDPAGKGADELHTINGDDTFGVEVLTDTGLVRRTNGQGPHSNYGEAIATQVGVRQDLLQAIFRPGSFLDLPGPEQIGLLASLAAPEDISETCKEHLGQHVPTHEIPKTMKGLDALETRLRERRPAAKKELKVAQEAAKVEAPDIPDSVKNSDQAKLRAEIIPSWKQQKAALREQIDARKAKSRPIVEPVKQDATAEFRADLQRLRDANEARLECPHCHKPVLHPEGSGLLSFEQAKEAADRLKEMIAKAEGSKEAPPPKDPPKDPVIVDLEGRIEAIDKQVSDADRWLFLQQQSRTKQDSVNRLVDEIEKIDKRLEIVSPKGPLRAALLDRGKQGEGIDLLKGMNGFLGAAGWGEMKITQSPWSLTFRGIPAGLLSKSERWMVNLAVQVALSWAGKVGILVLDDADVLDSNNRNLLSEAIAFAGKEGMFSQLILCASKADRELREVGPPGFTAHNVTKNERGYSVVHTLKVAGT